MKKQTLFQDLIKGLKLMLFTYWATDGAGSQEVPSVHSAARTGMVSQLLLGCPVEMPVVGFANRSWRG